MYVQDREEGEIISATVISIRTVLDEDVDHGQAALLGGQVQRRVARRVRRLVDDRRRVARRGQPLLHVIAPLLGHFSQERHRPSLPRARVLLSSHSLTDLFLRLFSGVAQCSKSNFPDLFQFGDSHASDPKGRGKERRRTKGESKQATGEIARGKAGQEYSNSKGRSVCLSGRVARCPSLMGVGSVPALRSPSLPPRSSEQTSPPLAVVLHGVLALLREGEIIRVKSEEE